MKWYLHDDRIIMLSEMYLERGRGSQGAAKHWELSVVDSRIGKNSESPSHKLQQSLYTESLKGFHKGFLHCTASRQSERCAKKIQSPTLHLVGRWSERLLLGTAPPMCDLDSREREGHLHLKELVPPWICLVSKDFFGKFHTFLSGQVLTFLPNFMKTSSNQRDFIWVHLPLVIAHFSRNKIITVFTNKVYNSKENLLSS